MDSDLNKSERIDLSLAALSARTQPGQTFSYAEIAAWRISGWIYDWRLHKNSYGN
jgi:hypothetical protein